MLSTRHTQEKILCYYVLDFVIQKEWKDVRGHNAWANIHLEKGDLMQQDSPAPLAFTLSWYVMLA